jgi:pimeloyl-ACP methyl ester carboxylesterase
MTAELDREVAGAGVPILLIHGNGDNTRIWGRSADDLAATHRVIAYDRRGFGRSRGPLARSMRDHVSDAAALLRELDAVPATVLGWSGGGVVAAGLAAEHPDMVSSLILEEPGIHLPLNNTVNLLRFGIKIEFARRIRRDERRAALEVLEFALAYRDGGNQFDCFPEDWRESMLASAPATVAETDHMRHPYPSRRARVDLLPRHDPAGLAHRGDLRQGESVPEAAHSGGQGGRDRGHRTRRPLRPAGRVPRRRPRRRGVSRRPYPAVVAAAMVEAATAPRRAPWTFARSSSSSRCWGSGRWTERSSGDLSSL